MTTRDFGMIDQDQSDNVNTTYLLNGNGQTAQTTAANAHAMPGARTIVNGRHNSRNGGTPIAGRNNAANPQAAQGTAANPVPAQGNAANPLPAQGTAANPCPGHRGQVPAQGTAANPAAQGTAANPVPAQARGQPRARPGQRGQPRPPRATRPTPRL